METLDKKVWGKQEGGDHYKGFAIQPTEFIMKNNLSFLEGCIVKRISRKKGGSVGRLDDLLKIKHEVDMILDLEGWKFPPEEWMVDDDWYQRLERIIEHTKAEHDLKHGTASPVPEKPESEIECIIVPLPEESEPEPVSRNKEEIVCIHRDAIGICKNEKAVKYWLFTQKVKGRRMLCADRWETCSELQPKCEAADTSPGNHISIKEA